jgi:hypothetical protein
MQAVPYAFSLSEATIGIEPMNKGFAGLDLKNPKRQRNRKRDYLKPHNGLPSYLR